MNKYKTQTNCNSRHISNDIINETISPVHKKSINSKSNTENEDVVPRRINSQNMRGERDTPCREAANTAIKEIANKHRHAKSKPKETISNI